jgi:hypothetical protein
MIKSGSKSSCSHKQTTMEVVHAQKIEIDVGIVADGEVLTRGQAAHRRCVILLTSRRK